MKYLCFSVCVTDFNEERHGDILILVEEHMLVLTARIDVEYIFFILNGNQEVLCESLPISIIVSFYFSFIASFVFF